VGLSQRRVESVRRYLIENGADLARINSIGMGRSSRRTPSTPSCAA